MKNILVHISILFLFIFISPKETLAQIWVQCTSDNPNINDCTQFCQSIGYYNGCINGCSDGPISCPPNSGFGIDQQPPFCNDCLHIAWPNSCIDHLPEKYYCCCQDSVLCPDGESIDTAIGCIPVGNTTDFAAFLLRWGFGIGGGIAFILIVVAGFQIITSGGFPDKVRAGKQLLTAAISGLLLIIFSAFILELFGVRILRLPGF